RSKQLLLDHRRVHGDWHPEIWRRVVQPQELFLRNPDDGEGLIVEANRSTDGSRIRVVQARPRSITEDCNRITAWCAGVEIRESPPSQHARTERLEVIARDKRQEQWRLVRRHRSGPLSAHVGEQS